MYGLRSDGDNLINELSCAYEDVILVPINTCTDCSKSVIPLFCVVTNIFLSGVEEGGWTTTISKKQRKQKPKKKEEEEWIADSAPAKPQQEPKPKRASPPKVSAYRLNMYSRIPVKCSIMSEVNFSAYIYLQNCFVRISPHSEEIAVTSYNSCINKCRKIDF